MSENSSAIKKISVSVISSVLAALIIYFLIDYNNKDNSGTNNRIDSSTNSNVDNNADLSNQKFELTKEATLDAWNQMQAIDDEHEINESEEGGSKTWTITINKYNLINTITVDPILVTHINNTIRVYEAVKKIFVDYETQVDNIMNSNLEDYLKYDKISLLQEQTKLELEEINVYIKDLNNSDRIIASKLAEKYNVSFIDRH